MATTLNNTQQKKFMCIGTEGQFVQNNIFSNIYYTISIFKKYYSEKIWKKRFNLHGIVD